MNFLQRVIVIPEKLQALAAAGILYLVVQLEILVGTWLSVDLTGVFQPIAVVLAAIFTMLAKLALEKLVPENWHTFVNSFLAWLASVVLANFLFQYLLQ